MKSIGIVICYIGKLPPYLSAFLRSCEYNPTVNWLIFTDDKTSYVLPRNVRIIGMNLHEMAELFSAKLGFPVNLTHPRLLCDYKPAYGDLLSDYLKEYDFWGHCDLDVVFGDLRKFFAEGVLEAYHKILLRGHLSLYRNHHEATTYYKLSAPGVVDYKKVYQSGKNHQFDEWLGIYKILRYNQIPQYDANIVVDLVPPSRFRIGRLEGYHIKNYPYQMFFWFNGRLFQSYWHDEGAPYEVEFAYIHFQKRSLPAPDFDASKTDGFVITPFGFKPYNLEDLSKGDFLKYNPDRVKEPAQIIRETLGKLKSRCNFFAK